MSVILGHMQQRAALLLIVASLLLAGCGDVAPTNPTPLPSLPSIPAVIALTATPGLGATAGQVFLVALVRDGAGKGVGSVPVHFTTTVGAVQPADAQADPGGQAQATVLTTTAATITATAGSATGSIVVTPTPAIEPPAIPPPPVPGPPPPPLPPPSQPRPTPPAPTPTPPPPPPPPALSVSINCVPAPHGPSTPTACNLAATYGGVAIPSTAIIRVDWDFGDGTSQTVSGIGAALITHTYVQAGTYLIVAAVDAITSDGDKGTSASLSIKIP